MARIWALLTILSILVTLTSALPSPNSSSSTNSSTSSLVYDLTISQPTVDQPPMSPLQDIYLSDLIPIFEPTKCVKYTGTVCGQFFGDDFYVGLDDINTVVTREYEILLRRFKLLTAPTTTKCDYRALANLCGRAFIPCRIKEEQTSDGNIATSVISIPYCLDCCSNLRCPVSATLPVDTRICYDPFIGADNKIPIPDGYSCEPALNWSTISEYDLSPTLENIIPNCPSPLINVESGNEFAFYSSYCSSPCPQSLYTEQQYQAQDIVFTVLNILSIVGLVVIGVSWYLFPRLRVKQYVYFYIASICLITLSLTVLIFLSWAERSGIAAALCETRSSEYHMSGYPLVQGLVCLFFFMGATCWALICSFDLFLIVVLGININKKHKYYLPIQVAYHVFCWGLALYSIIGPLAYSQIGGSTVGGSFAWVGAPRSAYIHQQNAQLASENTSTSSYDYNTIYDSGNTFFYTPLWIVTAMSVLLVLISLTKLFKYRCRHRKKTIIVGQDGSVQVISTRIGTLSIETFIRLVIFTISNILISLVFAFHKLLVVDQRGKLDIDETTYFRCLTGALLLMRDEADYNRICQRHSSLSPATAILLSALLNSMGLIAFLTYGTTPSLWKAWAGLLASRFDFQPFARYRDFYLQVLQPSTHNNTPRNNPAKPEEESQLFHFSETSRRRPQQQQGPHRKNSVSFEQDNPSIHHHNEQDEGRRRSRQAQQLIQNNRRQNKLGVKPTTPTNSYLPPVISSMLYQPTRRSASDGVELAGDRASASLGNSPPFSAQSGGIDGYNANSTSIREQHSNQNIALGIAIGGILEQHSREDEDSADDQDERLSSYDNNNANFHNSCHNPSRSNQAHSNERSDRNSLSSANSGGVGDRSNTKANQFNHQSRQKLEDQKKRDNIARQQHQINQHTQSSVQPTLVFSSSHHSAGQVISKSDQNASEQALLVPLSPSNDNLNSKDKRNQTKNQPSAHRSHTPKHSTNSQNSDNSHNTYQPLLTKQSISTTQSTVCNTETTATSRDTKSNNDFRDIDQRTAISKAGYSARDPNLPPLLATALLVQTDDLYNISTTHSQALSRASLLSDHDTISTPRPFLTMALDEERKKSTSKKDHGPDSDHALQLSRSSSATDSNGQIYTSQTAPTHASQTPLSGLGLKLNEIVILQPHAGHTSLHGGYHHSSPQTALSSAQHGHNETNSAIHAIPSSTITQQGIRIHSVNDNILSNSVPDNSIIINSSGNNNNTKLTGAHFTPKLPAQYVNNAPPSGPTSVPQIGTSQHSRGDSLARHQQRGESSVRHKNTRADSNAPNQQQQQQQQQQRDNSSVRNINTRAISPAIRDASQSRPISPQIRPTRSPSQDPHGAIPPPRSQSNEPSKKTPSNASGRSSRPTGAIDLVPIPDHNPNIQTARQPSQSQARPPVHQHRGISVEPAKHKTGSGETNSKNDTTKNITALKSKKDESEHDLNTQTSNADELLLRLQQFKLEDSFSISDDDDDDSL